MISESTSCLAADYGSAHPGQNSLANVPGRPMEHWSLAHGASGVAPESWRATAGLALDRRFIMPSPSKGLTEPYIVSGSCQGV
jgi:hypothetical protein